METGNHQPITKVASLKRANVREDTSVFKGEMPPRKMTWGRQKESVRPNFKDGDSVA